MQPRYTFSHRIWTNWKIDLGEKRGEISSPMSSPVSTFGTDTEFMSWNERQFFIVHQLLFVQC